MPTISDTLDTVGGEPAKAEGDQGKAEQHPIPDLMQLEGRRLGQQALAGTNRRGGRKSGFRALRYGVFAPRGTV